MTSSAGGISLRLKHSIDEDGEYGAFTEVDADILKHGRKIGLIEAYIVCRQKIPAGYFYAAMDGHSGALQYVGCSVYEPRYGRTKLKSLAEYDDPKSYFMYLYNLHIDDAWKQDNDIAADALHQFLHHPFIQGNVRSGRWKVSSAVCILSSLEAMSKEERAAHEAEMNDLSSAYSNLLNPPKETDETRRAKVAEKKRTEALERLNANAFLRNGFFQDPAIARQGARNMLVATYGHWRKPLLSQSQAEAIQFHVPAPKPPVPMGKDAEILQTVIEFTGKYSHSKTSMSTSEVAKLINKVTVLMHDGGFLCQSHAIHAACANNCKPAVESLLRLDPSIINSLDQANMTPLMIAAEAAAGRSTINGIPETHVIDTLIATGADKQQEDEFGLTAYGRFKKQSAEYEESGNAMMGKSCFTSPKHHPSHAAAERKLLPPLGPTTGDLTGGENEESGFMNYSQEDRELAAVFGDYDSDEVYDFADY